MALFLSAAALRKDGDWAKFHAGYGVLNNRYGKCNASAYPDDPEVEPLTSILMRFRVPPVVQGIWTLRKTTVV